MMTNLNTWVGATSTGFIMTWDRKQWRNLENMIMNFLTSLATISFSRSLLHGPKAWPCVISGLRRGANAIFAFFGCYAAQKIGTYRRFGTTYRSQIQGFGSQELLEQWRWAQRRLVVTNVSGQSTPSSGSSSPSFFPILQDGTNGLSRNVGKYQHAQHPRTAKISSSDLRLSRILGHRGK